MRFTLIVLLIQFFSPVLIQASPIDSHPSHTITTFNTADSPINPLILLAETGFEENEKYKIGDDKRSMFSLELVDFSHVVNALTFFHTQVSYNLTPPSLYSQAFIAQHSVLII